jgi:hypothetical protein
VIINLGSACTVATKVRNAQAAGASAVIIINSLSGYLQMDAVASGFTDVAIPAFAVTSTDGAALVGATGFQASISIGGSACTPLVPPV